MTMKQSDAAGEVQGEEAAAAAGPGTLENRASMRGCNGDNWISADMQDP